MARTKVRHWPWASERGAGPRALCWRCWRPTRRVVLGDADYAELLGLYRDRVRLCRRADVAQLMIHVGLES